MKAIVAFLLVAGVALVASPARACLCAPSAGVIWPLEGARDVARQVPLVIAVYGAPGIAHWQLETTSGDALETAVVRALEVAGTNGRTCESTLLFVSPLTTLDADTEYRVRTGRPQEADEVLSFRTGDAERPEQPALAVLEYDRLVEVGSFGGEVWDGVELRVRNQDVTLPSVLLLQVDGADQRYATLTGHAWKWSGSPRLGSDIATTTACVEVEQIDMTGSTLATHSLCTPDRCARLADDSSLLGSSCDSWVTLGDDFWDALPSGSCDAVPTVHIDAESGAVDVEGFGDQDDRPVREVPADEGEVAVPATVDEAAGCNLAPYPAARLPTCLLALAIVVCRAARRRDRFVDLR
jgi:hypothetical protein